MLSPIKGFLSNYLFVWLTKLNSAIGRVVLFIVLWLVWTILVTLTLPFWWMIEMVVILYMSYHLAFSPENIPSWSYCPKKE